MFQDPFSPFVNDEEHNSAHARLFEIVSFANTCTSIPELTAFCLDTVALELRFQLAFFLWWQDTPPYVLVQETRGVLPKLATALRDLKFLFDPPSPPSSAETLLFFQATVHSLLRGYNFTAPAFAHLLAGGEPFGMIVFAANSHPEAQNEWDILEHQEFLDAVGLHVGAAIHRLRQSEQTAARETWLRKFLDSGHAGYWQTDGQGRILAVNDAALKTLKRTRAQVIGKRIDELSDADPVRLRELRARLQREDMVHDLELDIRARDGEIRTIRETLHVARDANNNITEMQGIFQDITAAKQTLEQLQRRNRELEMLHQLATGLNQTLETDVALQAGVELILQLTNADALGIVQINELEGHYDLVAHQGLEPELVAAYAHAPFDRSIYHGKIQPETTWNLIEYIVLTGKTLTLEQLLEMPRFDISPILAHGYKSLLAFPIRFDNQVYGVVMVGSRNAQQFDDHAVQLVDNISAQLGQTLHNQRLVAALQLQVEQMELLIAAGRTLQYAPQADERLPHALRQLKRALGAAYCVIHLLRDENHVEYITASDTREAKRIFPLADYERRLLHSMEPLLVTDRDAPEVDPAQRASMERFHFGAAVGLRLYAQERPIGLLFVNYAAPREFAAHEVRLLVAFAQQIAYALQNKRLLDETNKQVGELKALAHVSRMIVLAPRPDRSLSIVADEIARVFQADYVGFHLREGNSLRLVAESKESGAPRVSPILPHQYRILEELDSIRVSNAHEAAAHPRQQALLVKYKMIADLGVPLVSGQKALGILYISQHQERVWTDAEQDLAETFAQQVTFALTQARALHDSEKQLRDWRTLSRSTSLLAHTRAPEHTLPQIAADLRRLLNADYVGFHLKYGNHLRAITGPQHNLDKFEYPIETYHRPTLEYGQKIITCDSARDAKDENHRARLEAYGYHSDLGVPMISRGNAIGILFISHILPHPWQDAEIQLAESFAQHIAIVLENVQLLNENETRARELTQLAELNEITMTIHDQDILETLVLEGLHNLLNADRVALVRTQDNVPQGLRTSDKVTYPVQPIPRTEGLELLLRSRRPVIVDPEHAPVWDGDYEERAKFHEIKSFLMLPLFTAAETLGALSFLFKTEHIFTDAEIRLAQAAANQVAMALANARHLREQDTRITRLTQLSQFSMWCGALRDSETLQTEAVARIRELLQISAASIRLVQDGYLTKGASSGYTDSGARDHMIRIDERLQRVLNTLKPYVVDNLKTEHGISEHWRKRHLAEGFEALLMVPMLAVNQVVGILTLFRRQMYHWQETEVQYAQNLANVLALALSNVEQIEKTERSRAELSATLDSVFSGVFRTDLNGNIQSWNRAAKQITGFTEAEMLGKAWHMDGPRVGVHQRADEIAFEAIAENRVQFSFLPRFWKCADGHIVQLRVAAAPLYDANGRVRGAVCAFWDRSEEQAAERAKVDYINLVGHQLGNKLTATLWGAEQLGRSNLNEAGRARLISILGDTRREMEDFNLRFQQFQREHSDDAIQANPLDLKAMVRKKVAAWRATHPEHKFHVRGKFASVVADEMRLAVVIENLLENACKYSPEGSPITVRCELPHPETVVLRIHNRGKPIPPELLPHLFERWQRGDSEQPGTGLGLWLVRTKLHEIGGEIRAESDARRGTRFVIILRRANPSA